MWRESLIGLMACTALAVAVPIKHAASMPVSVSEEKQQHACGDGCHCAACAVLDKTQFMQLTTPDWKAGHAVTLENISDKPTIIAFFRSDCAPCRVELKTLPKIAAQNGEVNVYVVVMQDKAQFAPALNSEWEGTDLPRNISVIQSQEMDNKKLLAAFGNDKQALPYSVALHKGGAICGQHYGVLGTDIAKEWATTC